VETMCTDVCRVFVCVFKTSARPVETIQHYQRAAELLLQVSVCVGVSVCVYTGRGNYYLGLH